MKVCRPSGTWAETYAGRKGHRTVATHCQQWGGQYALKPELHLFDYFLVYRERAVVTAKLLYASQAWCAFATTSDRQRIEAFIRRGVRLGLYGAGDPSANQLARTPTTACSGVMYSEHHALQHFLPDINSHRYSLRPRRHNFTLATKTNYRLYTVLSLHCTQLRSVPLKLKLLTD